MQSTSEVLQPLPAAVNKTKSRRLLRQTLTCLTSTISLVCLVILFIIAGGFLFLHIEGNSQNKRQQESHRNITNLKLKIFNKNSVITNESKQYKSIITQLRVILTDAINENQVNSPMLFGSNSSFTSHQQTQSLNHKLDQMDQILNQQMSVLPYQIKDNDTDEDITDLTDALMTLMYHYVKDGYDPKFSTNQTKLWTYARAVLYSVTVISTIGYGNIVPSTQNGKLVTIFYAMFGIPLMLLCLANLGSLLAKLLKLLYSGVVRRLCPPNPKQPLRRHRSSSSLTRKNSHDSIRSNCLTNNRLLGKNMLLLSSNSTKLTKISQAQSVHSLDLKEQRLDFTISIKADDLLNNVTKRVDKIELPIHIPLLIFFVYILIGSLVISFEENWNYLNSCYFVFITFSTIGFGDIVPGFIDSKWDNQIKPILCSIYLLFGLALISMCFQLIQDSMTKRAKRMAKQIGLVQSPSSA